MGFLRTFLIIKFFLGILGFAFLGYWVPEDIEIEDKKNKKDKKVEKEKKIKRVGIITALSIALHNFPEGIAVYLACLNGLKFGIPIAIAIGAHNIPEGMAVASPIYHSTGSRWTAFKYSTISGLFEPIAALVFGLFFSSYFKEEYNQFLLASVAGIMVLVSFKELLPTALQYISAQKSMISNGLGMAFIAISIFFLHDQTDHNGHK